MYKAHVSRHGGFMIGAAYQQGIFVQVISSEGQILFTQKGKLLRCSSEVVSFLKGNDLLFVTIREARYPPIAIRMTSQLKRVHQKALYFTSC